MESPGHLRKQKIVQREPKQAVLCFWAPELLACNSWGVLPVPASAVLVSPSPSPPALQKPSPPSAHGCRWSNQALAVKTAIFGGSYFAFLRFVLCKPGLGLCIGRLVRLVISLARAASMCISLLVGVFVVPTAWSTPNGKQVIRAEAK